MLENMSENGFPIWGYTGRLCEFEHNKNNEQSKYAVARFIWFIKGKSAVQIAGNSFARRISPAGAFGREAAMYLL
jgi:hypothetical protein